MHQLVGAALAPRALSTHSVRLSRDRLDPSREARPSRCAVFPHILLAMRMHFGRAIPARFNVGRVLSSWTCALGLASGSLGARAAEPRVLDPNAMDRSVDPCSDFYTYSCGNWLRQNPIPPDQSRWSAYSKLQDETLQRLRQILEQASKGGAERSAAQQKIGDYYGSCMDEARSEKLGAAPLEARLVEVRGLSSKPALAAWLGRALPRDPEGLLFSYSSGQDYRHATDEIAQLDQNGLGLPDRDFYTKRDAHSLKLRADYLAHVAAMFVLAGESAERARGDAKTVLRIETALAEASQTRVERRNPDNVYHPMTPAQLTKLSPGFAWKEFFAESGGLTPARMNVVAPRFFQALGQWIEKENLAVWKTYLSWHLIKAKAPLLSAAFVNQDFAFFGKTLEGREALPPRWKRCTEQVDEELGEALGRVYVEKYFPPVAKERAQRMVSAIQAAMDQEINALPWMSAATKQKAKEKLQAMANKIGYPERWRDYASLEVRPGDALGNAERAATFEYRRQLAKIGQPVDRGEWQMTPSTVNAYYDPQLNDMNFPAAVLQPPLFDVRTDDASNYGNTGATIGHELTHGFDDEGRRFDAQGNLRDWWTAQDGKQFERRVACVSSQYSDYTVIDEIKINGKLTAGEDVADLGGLIIAYAAWKATDHDQSAPALDGLSPEQRFFVAYGQSWCTNERDERKRVRATVDPHSPEKYRTNGVVSNLPEFQQAFQCKADAPMVRKQRCQVW
jgi:endothelin-converting enzyme/putative endopeptidase